MEVAPPPIPGLLSACMRASGLVQRCSCISRDGRSCGLPLVVLAWGVTLVGFQGGPLCDPRVKPLVVVCCPCCAAESRFPEVR